MDNPAVQLSVDSLLSFLIIHDRIWLENNTVNNISSKINIDLEIKWIELHWIEQQITAVNEASKDLRMRILITTINGRFISNNVYVS